MLFHRALAVEFGRSCVCGRAVGVMLIFRVRRTANKKPTKLFRYLLVHGAGVGFLLGDA